MYLTCSRNLYSSLLQWEELPELSASIMYLAESQVALISQQARWQHCVGSACGRGAVRRGPAASWREDCSHPGSLSTVPVQLCFSLQLELLICSICGRGQRVKQNTCLVAEAWQAGAACTPFYLFFLLKGWVVLSHKSVESFFILFKFHEVLFCNQRPWLHVTPLFLLLASL